MIGDANGDDSVSMRTYAQKPMPIQIQAKPTTQLLNRTVTKKSKPQNIDTLGYRHRPRIPSPPSLREAKTGRNHLNEDFTLLLPTGIGERF